VAFDALFFNSTLQEQIRGLGGVPVVRVILHDGREFLVRSIRQAAQGYLTLEIYPPQGISRGQFEFPPAASLIDLATYPTAIAYEAIAQVFLQAAPADQGTRLGFQTRAAGA
jgi:hypothetical protein